MSKLNLSSITPKRRTIKPKKGLCFKKGLKDLNSRGFRSPLRTCNIKKSRKFMLNTFIMPPTSPSTKPLKGILKPTGRQIISIKKRKDTSDSTCASSDSDYMKRRSRIGDNEAKYWREVHNAVSEFIRNRVDDAKRARFSPFTSPSRLMQKITQVRNHRRVISPSFSSSRNPLSLKPHRRRLPSNIQAFSSDQITIQN
mmetsp:Transcript_21994/g.21713  ORF Transcript_21994/g.21713 Transcript_21994/m.21713 type:complete len:198 (-) Transcript_21994:85-678(-)